MKVKNKIRSPYVQYLEILPELMPSTKPADNEDTDNCITSKKIVAVDIPSGLDANTKHWLGSAYCPYVKKRLISSRFEEFVKYNDIPTPIDPRIEKNFMIKSGSEMGIEHFTKDPKILVLIWSFRKNIELISLDIAKEDTDPHLQATFDIFPNDLSAIQKAIDLFFLIANAHLSENEAIRKKRAARKSRRAAIKTKSAKKKKKKQK